MPTQLTVSTCLAKKAHFHSSLIDRCLGKGWRWNVNGSRGYGFQKSSLDGSLCSWQKLLCSPSSLFFLLEWGSECWSSSSCMRSMKCVEWTHMLWTVEQKQEGSRGHWQNCARSHHRSPGTLTSSYIKNSLTGEKNKSSICLWDSYEYLNSFPHRYTEPKWKMEKIKQNSQVIHRNLYGAREKN